MATEALPIPPLEMREFVGRTDLGAFDNPTGKPIFDFLPLEAYEAVFDFGCGCGRLARRLLQQHPAPLLYTGIDLHKGMIRWCVENLAPHRAHYHFVHHDIYHHHFNPGADKPRTLPFPVSAQDFSLVVAWSVFTHLTESQADYYLHEVARILRPDGIFLGTWFLFDKQSFPMMQSYTNALYIDHVDPSAAVIFDRTWLVTAAAACGLTITASFPPTIRGHQWQILMTRTRPGVVAVELPPDNAPFGDGWRAPTMPEKPAHVGLTGSPETSVPDRSP